jgi:serine/threonine protein kinase
MNVTTEPLARELRYRSGNDRASNDRDERISQAIGEFLAAIESGDADRSALLTKYRDVAQELAGCLEALDFMNAVAPQLAAADAAVMCGSPDLAHPASNIQLPASNIGVLGDFRILREIGRGGMGVVYEAEQLSIGRRVALKVLPFAAMLDRQQLNRFKNEARAAGTLDHPNIVAIHSVGCERGVHYYAMQLIEGQSLAQVVEQLRRQNDVGCSMLDVGSRHASTIQHPASNIDSALRGSHDPAHPASNIQHPTSIIETQPIAALSTLPDFDSRDYFRTIVQLGIQAAEALDHAHQNGILHRDIKPANLLVDDAGKLWITDFGLARMEQDAGMTMTGDILGTLRYMSPEQALAKRVVVDHRSDIYSLGVTLYELLTLQPAFTGDDRQELLRQIAFEEPRPPRQFIARIPPDLETIVLKAIEKNPADRYATAQQLAEELQRYLHDQPIKAKQPSLYGRARKWSRRHKALVASVSLSAAAIALFSLVVLAVSNMRVTRERNEKAAALEDRTAALERAERNFQMVLSVIDRSLERVGDETLADVPQMEQLRKKLLADSLEFYEKLLSDNSNDPLVRFATARVYARVATIIQGRAEWDESIRCNEKAIAILEHLVASQPSNASYRFALATALKQRSWNAMAIPSSHTDDAHRASRAVELLQGLHDEFPSDLTYQESLLETLLTRNYWSSTTAEKERLLARMVPLADLPNMNKRLRGEVKGRHADLALARGRLDESEATYREAIGLHREAVNEHPTQTMARFHLINENIRLATLLTSRGRREEAVRYFEESMLVAQGMRHEFPMSKQYDQLHIAALAGLAHNLHQLGRTVEETEALSKRSVNGVPKRALSCIG